MDFGYCHLEKLSNLDQLPATGFRISCFPFKIKAASAGFVRAVGILEAWRHTARTPPNHPVVRRPLAMALTTRSNWSTVSSSTLSAARVSRSSFIWRWCRRVSGASRFWMVS